MDVASIPEMTSTSQWRDGYSAGSAAYDEMLSPGQDVREHWHPLVSQFDRIEPKELTRRWEQGRRLIQENGVTYNVCGDPRGMDRPWELDSVPMMISAAEW